MTDDQTIEPIQPKARRNWGKIGILITTIALVVFILTFGYGLLELTKVNISLSKMVASLQQDQIEDQKQLVTLQQSLQSLSEVVQKHESLQAQQEKNLANLKTAQEGDLSRFHVAEAAYLTRLANDHLQFSRDMPLAMNLLQQANEVLKQVDDPNLLEIKKNVAADIIRLQSQPKVDYSAIYLRVVGLDKAIDQLPLPTSPLATPTSTPLPDTKDLSWWKRAWAYTVYNLKQVVIVKKSDANALPLVMPDETALLYQNLHADLQGVMWALMHQNNDIYAANLARAIAIVSQYFVQESDQTKTMLQNLQALQKINISSPDLNLSTTLKSFDAYLNPPEAKSENTPQP